jgi:hypothetical protein
MRVVRWVAAVAAVASFSGCGALSADVAGRGFTGPAVPVSYTGQDAAERLLTEAAASMAEANTGTLHAISQVEGHSWSNKAIMDARFDLTKDRWSAAMNSNPSGKGAQLPQRGTTEMIGAGERTFVRSQVAATWIGFRAPAGADGTAEGMSLLEVLRQAVGTSVFTSAGGVRTVHAEVPLMVAIGLFDPDGILADTYPKLRVGAERVAITVSLDGDGRPARLDIAPVAVRPLSSSSGFEAAVATGEFHARFEDLGARVQVSLPQDVRMLTDDEFAGAMADLTRPTGT